MHRPIPIIAALAGLVLAMAPAAVAQDEPSDALEHPIIGSWIIDTGDGDPSLEFTVFGPGGTMLDASVDGVAVGAWAATGDRSVDITFLNRAPAPTVGSFTIRGSLEVSEDGDSFTGTYSFEPSPEIAANFGMEPGELGPGEVTGQRITVEPMGEPVGPLPDFDEPSPGDQGMSPAPEGSPAMDDPPTVDASPEPQASPAG